MNLLFRRLVVIFFAWLASGLAASLSAATTVAPSKFQVVIDGVVYPGGRAFDGGDLVAGVAEDQLGAGVQKKHVTNTHVSPLRLDFAANNFPGLIALMNEVLTTQGTTHNVNVSRVDYTSTILDTIEFPSAMLVGLELCPYVSSSKVQAVVTLIFQPTQVHRTNGNGSKATSSGPAGQAPLASNFRFALDGLPGQYVSSVSALSVRRTVINDVGVQRDPTAGPVKLGISHLILEISTSGLADWVAWSESFLSQGHSQDTDEKSGSLTPLAADLTTAIFSIQFSHVGLVRLSQSAAVNSNAASQFEVELYLEGASITTTVAAAGSGTASTNSSSTTAADPGTSTTPSADTSSAATTGPAPDLPAVGNQATATRSTELTSVPLKNPPLASMTAGVSLAHSASIAPSPGSATSSASSDPADQGVRDPREFPRVEGVIRRSYDSVDYEASSQETVTYSSKLGVRELAANYEAALNKANWELLRKDETGNAADFTYYFAMKWSTPLQTCDLRFSQTKSGGTSVTIFVDTHRQGILSGLAAALKDAGKVLATKEGSPNDVGARDPADFPRISGSTRKSYSSSGSATAPAEDAVYRAKIAIAGVEGFYVNQLGQADWEESVRREEGDRLGGSHAISMNWSLGKRAVKISLREIEPALTEISVSLSTSG